MTREQIIPNPSQKLFEVYLDYSGGLNSETGNEMLKDNEFPVLNNVDLVHRGSALRRQGRTLVASVTGTGQGLWYYKREGQDTPDLVVAVSGQLYYIPNGTTTPIQIGIIDKTNNYATLTFQNSKSISAAQYMDTLYVATGTKFCKFGYDASPAWIASHAYNVGDTVNVNNQIYVCTVAGTSAASPATGPSGTTYGTNITDGTVTWQYDHPIWYAEVVTPYTPTSMEAVYIGLNGLASDPSSYITDSQGQVFQVNAVVPAPQQFGIVNQLLNLTAILEKPSTVTSVKYQWSYRLSVQSGTPNAWTSGLTGNDAAGKTYQFTPTQASAYDIQVVVTDNTTGVQNPATYTYIFSSLQVYATSSSAPNQNIDVTGIQQCRNVMAHWDRLLLWGDDTAPWQVYISDLTNPAYFPVTNTVPFDIGKQEPITSVLEWRGNIVVFTTTSVQILTGKSPDTYTREILYYTMGCIAERCAGVTGNTITFLSAEGVHALKPNPYMIDVMDLNRVDYQIKSELVKDVNARAMVFDSQFWLNIPSKNYVYRMYYEQGGVWVRDVSSKLHFVDMIHYGDIVHNLSTDGNIYLVDTTSSVWADGDENYVMDVESKYLSLGASFNWKKLKRLFFLAQHFTKDVNIEATVYADSAIVLTTGNGSPTLVHNADGSVSVAWTVTDVPPTDTTGLTAWTQNTAYVIGNTVYVNNSAYVCVSAGTSSTTAPNGQGGAIVDGTVIWKWTRSLVPDPSTGWFQFLAGSVAGTWNLSNTPLGDVQVSVLYTHIRGKARRVKVKFTHSDATPCEVFGFGIEFKEKKPY